MGAEISYASPTPSSAKRGAAKGVNVPDQKPMSIKERIRFMKQSQKPKVRSGEER